jgi:ankyrin repeat protein
MVDMVELDKNVKKIFSAMQSMAGEALSPAQKIKKRAKLYRLIELVPVDSVNGCGETLLIKAIRDEDTDLVRHLLQKGANIDGFETNDSPLMVASGKGHVEIMQILIESGADLHAFRVDDSRMDDSDSWDDSDDSDDSQISDGYSDVLYHAICSENIEAVRLLLASGLKTFNESACGTPLHMAAECNDAPMVSLLIEHGAGDVSAVDYKGHTALQFAVRSSQGDITASLAALLDHGAAIDQLSSHGYSALHIAAHRGKISAALFLLDRGANAALVDGNGETALHMARSVEIVTALLAHGAPVNAVDCEGKTPLHHCATYGDKWEYGYRSQRDITVLLAALLDHGAAIDQLSRDGESILHYAVEHGKQEVVSFLLGRGANAAIVDSNGETALHKARSAVMVTALMAHGAPANAVDKYGMTPLHCCAADRERWDKQGNVDSLAALLDHGAAIDQRSRGGKSALHYAVGNSELPAVSLLLGRGANAALADSDGETALHKAYTEVEIVTALLAHGAPVNAVDCKRMTTLHHCATQGNLAALPVATALLQAGADVNTADKYGNAALHRWAMICYDEAAVEFAQLLIDHGADILVHNNANKRPSEVARTGSIQHTFLLAAEEAQRNNHRYKRPRLEDLQPPAAIAAGAETAVAVAEEEEDESEDDSEDEEEDD